MSLLRWPVYVWSDGPRMHLWARVDTEGVGDPIHFGTEGSEFYPGFVSGVVMPIEVWDDIVTRYLEKRDIYLASDEELGL